VLSREKVSPLSEEAVMSIRIGVIGLGYVGLPLALAFARKFPGTIGFDINEHKVGLLKKGVDVTSEGLEDQIRASTLKVTATASDLSECNFFVVGVPTPVDHDHRPDLQPVISASELVGDVLRKGSTVVFESTVYPGVTEEICGPILAKRSGLRHGIDFKLGYSPERINPGDKEHTLETILKVVSGEDAATLELVAEVYGKVITAGIYKAPSIKVAEAAKVIENTQRDLNIALMNELSLIFDRMNIRTKDVLDAASTKWNFLRFSPGLVGGHCIGVDPYYLTTKAEQLGYHPQVILAGRRINDGMGTHVAQRMVKLMVNAGLPTKGAKVGILGLTFKENVHDIRNSRVPDIIKELREFGVIPLVHDPLADPHHTKEEYGISLSSWEDLQNLDGIVVAVNHKQFIARGAREIAAKLRPNGVFIDIKSAFDSNALPSGMHYWSL
jgi:UDP-N-acetyl-D-galactosamine dehydrogenase